MEDHRDRKISTEEAAVKPVRSFRYEDYSTRRVFLRSYPLQWDSPAAAAGDEKQRQHDAAAAVDDDDCRYGGRDVGWKRQVAEWGEDKLLLLRRVRKRLALYLLGCHYAGRPALPYKSRGSCTTAMLKSI